MKLMMDLNSRYLSMCEHEKRLNPKTIKAYRIDLRQFTNYLENKNLNFDRDAVKMYISYMNDIYLPRTVKRKIASIRALCRWLEDEHLIEQNPFYNLCPKVKEPLILPKTVSLYVVERLLEAAHSQAAAADVNVKEPLRDTAVMELLFATGIRVSELCGLNTQDIDLENGMIHIYGKGSKERIIQLTNSEVISTFKEYIQLWSPERNDAFFKNRLGNRLSDQSVRRILRKYAKKIGSKTKITPHMFRHTLATQLLEAEVDIRYIQQLLGHASILTTQIYTHVAGAKQRDILTKKHPRNKFSCSASKSADVLSQSLKTSPKLYI